LRYRYGRDGSIWPGLRIPVKADTVYGLKAATITVARRTALR
jgi:hypothetical protein